MNGPSKFRSNLMRSIAFMSFVFGLVLSCASESSYIGIGAIDAGIGGSVISSGGIGGGIASSGGIGNSGASSGGVSNSGGTVTTGGVQNFGGIAGAGLTCRAAYCPSSGSGVPCCTTSDVCGADFGMGCAPVKKDAGP